MRACLSTRAGAPLDARDRDGQTALRVAVEYELDKYARLLLDHGADPNAKDKRGDTALHECPTRRLADLLLARGANLEAKNRDGETPLHRAVARQRMEVVRFFLARKANAKARTKHKRTALHLIWDDSESKERHGGELTKMLLEAGLDPNAVDAHGWTPLHVAASFDNRAQAEALLAAGADPAARDPQGRTPLDVARERKFKRMVAFLQKVEPAANLARRGAELASCAKYVRSYWKPQVSRGESPSRFGGAPLMHPDDAWPSCPMCDAPLSFLLQLDLASLPGSGWGRGLLQVFSCTRGCDLADRRWLSSREGGVRILAPRKGQTSRRAPAGTRSFPAKSITAWKEGKEYPGRDEQQRLGLGDDVKKALEGETCATKGDKLLGWPRWTQSPEHPKCPRCKKPMRYLIQIGSHDHVPFVWADMGTAHVQQCSSHRDELIVTWAGG